VFAFQAPVNVQGVCFLSSVMLSLQKRLGWPTGSTPS